jgi:hypothetical protein
METEIRLLAREAQRLSSVAKESRRSMAARVNTEEEALTIETELEVNTRGWRHSPL